MKKGLNIYVVRDVIADDVVNVATATTDGMFVRTFSKGYAQLNSNFLNDFEVYCVGHIDFDTLENVSEPKRKVSWDSYKFPETVVEKK